MVSQGVSEINNLWKELTLLGMVVDDWTVVGTNKQTGWKNIDDMIAYAKEHPGEIKYGLTGTGNGMAVTQKVCDMLGIECTIVPYDGGAESRAALLGNHIQLENTQSSDARNYVASGDIIPLYVIASTRCPLFPDTPTLQELGYDLVLGAPRGYYAPPELDPQITAYYENMLEEVCKNEAFVKACADLGYVVNFVGSADGMKWQEEYYKTQISLTK
jgi:tripartite-type tricarboxylate transporter receptor subunit TctC